MEGYKLYLAAVSVQVFHSIMHIVSKAAIDDGFKTYILVFYRQAIATVFLAPITIFLEWKSAPPLTVMTFVKMCILSLLGFTLTWNLNNMALRYTSAPLAAAINNTIPVSTFFLAVLFRMENFNLKTVPGISKFAGIALCLGGSATIAFYHGAPYLKLLVHHHLLKIHSLENPGHAASSTTWVKGVLLMFLAYILWSSWLVLQVKLMTLDKAFFFWVGFSGQCKRKPKSKKSSIDGKNALFISMFWVWINFTLKFPVKTHFALIVS
ncbi:WAT1-related protein At5g64700-like isoform X1 [Coffea eugenioides]|uniref:WAT1-related protein At5g64700-like isoform X1 n=1 Tax=Coffea eugenioides TaxID=49369 RepID=UPI000F60477A|nr:WAT1-related protein At5g64700-like isoform X1 [Coffea eugenioides]